MPRESTIVQAPPHRRTRVHRHINKVRQKRAKKSRARVTLKWTIKNIVCAQLSTCECPSPAGPIPIYPLHQNQSTRRSRAAISQWIKNSTPNTAVLVFARCSCVRSTEYDSQISIVSHLANDISLVLVSVWRVCRVAGYTRCVFVCRPSNNIPKYVQFRMSSRRSEEEENKTKNRLKKPEISYIDEQRTSYWSPLPLVSQKKKNMIELLIVHTGIECVYVARLSVYGLRRLFCSSRERFNFILFARLLFYLFSSSP